MGTVIKILIISVLVFMVAILFAILRANSMYEEWEAQARREVDNGEIQEEHE